MTKDVLRTCISSLADVALANGAVGVLLAGSAAIGCEHEPANGPKYGDVDMYIGLPGRSTGRVSPQWCPRSLAGRPLHVSFVTEAAARRAQPTLRLFEAKASGIPVAGDDIREWFPHITLSTLDVGDLNDIVLWRLHDLAGAWGQYLTTGDPSYLGYASCKNILDLSIWAYPHLGLLLPDVITRLDSVPSVDPCGVVGEVVSRFARLGPEALRAKRGAPLTQEPVELFRYAAGSFLVAAEGILARSPSLLLGADLSDTRLKRRWAARRSLALLRPKIPHSAISRIQFLQHPHREMLRLYVSNWSALTKDLSLLRSTRTVMAALFGGLAEEAV